MTNRSKDWLRQAERDAAQLITAADGSHLWSERYDREMTDVFTIQDEISQAIAEKLRVRLSGDCPLVKRHMENVEAYSLYLKARYHLFKFTPEGFAKSKEYCEQAIAVDSKYALAWLGWLARYGKFRLGGILRRSNETFENGLLADYLVGLSLSTN